MRLFGWSGMFTEKHAKMDVSSRVRKTEMAFWCAMLGWAVLIVAGASMMMKSFLYYTLGASFFLVGVVAIPLSVIIVFIRIATYEIIMEIRTPQGHNSVGKPGSSISP